MGPWALPPPHGVVPLGWVLEDGAFWPEAYAWSMLWAWPHMHSKQLDKLHVTVHIKYTSYMYILFKTYT